jgi:hypothetical protein
MCPCFFVSADFGLLKFRHFVDLSIEEDVSMPGIKFVVTMALYLGGSLSHFNEIIHSFKNNNNFGVWPGYYL